MLERTPSRSRSSERLGDRRRRAKRRAQIALGILALVLFGGALWGLWQPSARIAHVDVVAGDPSLVQYATSELAGRDLGFLPRDSTFFPPEGAIRADILSSHPEIAAVSIYHAGFDSLAIKADDRTAVGRWCGLASTPDAPAYCYVFDDSGLIYAALPDETGTTTASTTAPVAAVLPTPDYLIPLNPFTLYAPLAGGTEEPLQATLADADAIPAAFDFARQVASFGSPVVSVYIHSIADATSSAPASAEVDDALASGTRILYVLGQEDEAYTALMSAKGQFNLTDGALDYVDLRFSGKMYLKPKE